MDSTACRLGFLLALLLGSGAQADGDCPADGRTWVPFGQNCYYFVHGHEDVFKSYSIEQAKGVCRDLTLLTVRSTEENKFIADYSLNVWKGDVNVWLGMYYDTDDEDFKWNDESPLSYKNWVTEGTSNSDIPPMDTCVALHSASGQWENVSCSSQNENGVVCKTVQKPVEPKKKSSSPLLSALVVLSVVAILAVSAIIWFFQQRHSSGSSLLPSFEYHPPFRSPPADETCLVEAEELQETS